MNQNIRRDFEAILFHGLTKLFNPIRDPDQVGLLKGKVQEVVGQGQTQQGQIQTFDDNIGVLVERLTLPQDLSSLGKGHHISCSTRLNCKCHIEKCCRKGTGQGFCRKVLLHAIAGKQKRRGKGTSVVGIRENGQKRCDREQGIDLRRWRKVLVERDLSRQISHGSEQFVVGFNAPSRGNERGGVIVCLFKSCHGRVFGLRC